jgi:glutamate-ammonia-ligase adenylyltransferase
VTRVARPESRRTWEGGLAEWAARAGVPGGRESLPLARNVLALARDPRQGLDLLARLGEELPATPHARRALVGFDRWSSHLVTPAAAYTLLLEHPRMLHDLLWVLAASPFLTDILAREPELYVLLTDPGARPRLRDYRRLAIEAVESHGGRPEAARAALRRLKRREILRIAWRDLLGHARFAATVARISALAEGLVAAALELAIGETSAQLPSVAGQVSLAVIALGKLGGKELNYSSDIDLLVVFDSPDPRDPRQQLYARRAAERLIHILAEESAEGRLFRVDMRLRPEGRFGDLARSLGSCREYYDRWVETWERQALIKARPVAGSALLGRRFMELARTTAFERGHDPDLPEDVRDVKLLMEKRAAESGRRSLNVKEGRGTIRDVEFAVQLIQLLSGSGAKELRNPNTLAALAALRRRGIVSAADARALARGYRFFRAVEHRLQLKEDLPERYLPEDPEERRCLARLMGHRGWPEFDAACRGATQGIRRTCDRIYAHLGAGGGGAGQDLRPWILSLESAEAREAVAGHLKRLGFVEIDQSLVATERLAVAVGRSSHPLATRRAFADLAPALFQACAGSADPDQALAAFQRLADRKVLHRAFYQRFLEDPQALADVCLLGGASPALVTLLLNFPQYLETALNREEWEPPRDLADLLLELEQRMLGAVTRAQRLTSLRRFRLRHLVRLAAREVLSPADPETIAAEWTAVAEVCLRAALEAAFDQARRECRWAGPGPGGFSVVALGRLGGRELQFGSDLDLFYLFEPRGRLPRDYEMVAQGLDAALTETTQEGRLFEIDLRLRPEGRSGFLVSSAEACQRYYLERADAWEKQAFLRARWVAGSAEVAGRFLEFVAPLIYPRDVPSEWMAESRSMRRRMERERVSADERQRHVKLGPGGLADIEFLVQWLQRANGARHPSVRVPGTLAAIEALAGAGALPGQDASALASGWRFLTRLRQRLWLCLGEGRGDVLPEDERELRRVARSLGFADGRALLEEYGRVASAMRTLYLRHMGE